MDTTTTQQPKVQQFESTGFQNPQKAAAAAETSGNNYHSYDGKSELVGGKGRKVRGGMGERRNFLKLYIKFFGGKKFSATRVVSNSKNSQ